MAALAAIEAIAETSGQLRADIPWPEVVQRLAY